MGISQKDLSFRGAIVSSSKLSTKKLVLASIFCALNIVLTRFFSVMIMEGTVRLGFGNLPIILSGMLLGPFAGALTGIVSDIIGVMVNPMGSFHPGITLSMALTGFIPGLIVALNPKNKFSFINIITSHLLVYILISLGLTTFWLTQLMGRAFIVMLPGRAIGNGITSIVSIIVINLLSKFIKNFDI